MAASAPTDFLLPTYEVDGVMELGAALECIQYPHCLPHLVDLGDAPPPLPPVAALAARMAAPPLCATTLAELLLTNAASPETVARQLTWEGLGPGATAPHASLSPPMPSPLITAATGARTPIAVATAPHFRVGDATVLAQALEARLPAAALAVVLHRLGSFLLPETIRTAADLEADSAFLIGNDFASTGVTPAKHPAAGPGASPRGGCAADAASTPWGASSGGGRDGALLRCADRMLAALPTVPTGCGVFDGRLLHGGFLRGCVTEIAGPAGAGKTQFLLQTVLNTAAASLRLFPPSPTINALKPTAAIYLVAEDVPHQRMMQLAVAAAAAVASDVGPAATATAVLERVLVREVKGGVDDLEAALVACDVVLTRQQPGVAAVVALDSIAAALQPPPPSSIYAAAGPGGRRAVTETTLQTRPDAAGSAPSDCLRIGQKLKVLAARGACAVVVANQVRARFAATPGVPTSSTAFVPALGASWAAAVNVRILLKLRRHRAVAAPSAATGADRIPFGDGGVPAWMGTAGRSAPAAVKPAGVAPWISDPSLAPAIGAPSAADTSPTDDVDTAGAETTTREAVVAFAPHVPHASLRYRIAAGGIEADE